MGAAAVEARNIMQLADRKKTILFIALAPGLHVMLDSWCEVGASLS
jgi:hypothetical protein